jgi:hypothetical protein
MRAHAILEHRFRESRERLLIRRLLPIISLIGLNDEEQVKLCDQIRVEDGKNFWELFERKLSYGDDYAEDFIRKLSNRPKVSSCSLNCAVDFVVGIFRRALSNRRSSIIRPGDFGRHV